MSLTRPAAQTTKTNPSDVQQRRLAALAKQGPLSAAATDEEAAPLLQVSRDDLVALTDLGYSEQEAQRALQMTGSLDAALSLLLR
jgi:Holliday junction resolvasome RuvABC DNA-binding subunit